MNENVSETGEQARMIRRRIIAQAMATERAVHYGVDHLTGPEKQYTSNTALQSKLSTRET
jgi:hypothetical protein